MKAAAAVLGASLLFFVGVLTGVGRRESIPPPAAIPLGVVQSTTSDPAAPASSSSGGRSAGKSPATRPAPGVPPASVTPTSPSRPSGSPGSSAPAGATSGTTGPTVTTVPSDVTPAPESSTTTATTGQGQVQPVDNQVDCTSTGRRGKARQQPCPSTTTSAGGPGGGTSR